LRKKFFTVRYIISVHYTAPIAVCQGKDDVTFYQGLKEIQTNSRGHLTKMPAAVFSDLLRTYATVPTTSSAKLTKAHINAPAEAAL
jgi:hypothetical protein